VSSYVDGSSHGRFIRARIVVGSAGPNQQLTTGVADRAVGVLHRGVVQQQQQAAVGEDRLRSDLDQVLADVPGAVGTINGSSFEQGFQWIRSSDHAW
jgi:hypothetical protein